MTVQDILNDLIPGLLPLGLTLLIMKLPRKKISFIILSFLLFAISIIGYGLGILA